MGIELKIIKINQPEVRDSSGGVTRREKKFYIVEEFKDLMLETEIEIDTDEVWLSKEEDYVGSIYLHPMITEVDLDATKDSLVAAVDDILLQNSLIKLFVEKGYTWYEVTEDGDHYVCIDIRVIEKEGEKFIIQPLED